MTMGTAVKRCFSNYAKFEGRAPRSEYWFFVLWTTLINLGIGFIIGLLFSDNERLMMQMVNALSTLFALVVLLPTLAVHTRRLHDTGRSGWWFLLYFTLLGGIVVFVWLVMGSESGPNKYGNPVSG